MNTLQRLAEVLNAPNPGPYYVRVGSKVRADEGYCYRGRVYENGKQIGTIFDAGTGGEPEIEFGSDANAIARLEAYAKTLPPDTTYGDPLPYSLDLFLSTLAELDIQIAGLKRHAKTKTVFASADGVNVYTSTRRYDDEASSTAWLAAQSAKHPGAVLLNPLLLAAPGMLGR